MPILTLFTKFMELPFELREAIYDAYFELENVNLSPEWTQAMSLTQDSKSSHTRSEQKVGHHIQQILRPLCFTNKQIYQEPVVVFLRHVTFRLVYIDSALRFMSFLGTIPEERGFKAIRELTFESSMFDEAKEEDLGEGPFRSTLYLEQNRSYWKDFFSKTNWALRLMKSCPNLHHVNIHLGARAFMEKTWHPLLGGYYTCMDIETMRTFYQMDDFFECKALHKILFRVSNRNDRRVRGNGNGWKAVLEMRAWLKEGFNERGRDVDVKLSLLETEEVGEEKQRVYGRTLAETPGTQT